MQQSSGLQACNFIKKRLQHGCFTMNTPKVFGAAFFIEKFWWLLFNYISVSWKKEVSGEIAFDLISLFHVQIQKPTNSSTTTRAFVSLAKFAEFYNHKIYEARSQWQPKHLCEWMWPLWPLYNWRKRFINVSWSKNNDITNPNREMAYQLISQSCFYCPNLIAVAQACH